jgi:hypothetical protein
MRIFRDLADHVKSGVWEAGGCPVTSLGESIMRPTAMLFRNLARIGANRFLGVHAGAERQVPGPGHRFRDPTNAGLSCLVMSRTPHL